MKSRAFLTAALILFLTQPVFFAQNRTYKSYPSREGLIDIRDGFAEPPKGYGNVPFYWWSGDSLRLDRLEAQLDILASSATDGFAVSYNHTDAKVDTVLNAAGHGFCGIPDYGNPRVFSDEWWKIWNSFSGMCADRGLAVGMDDYAFAWPGNRDVMDRVNSDARFEGYRGKLIHAVISSGVTMPDNVLVSEPREGDSLLVISTAPSPVPHLAALFEDRGEESIRTRLDYAEVVTQLAEERFFKPVYDWNASRGLIYGCDNMGRGLEPLQYMDYFRAISWFAAPGNDAPSRGSSFTQTKVSSSVTHLYDRPRAWLEAFHSMGWDANGAVLTHQLDHHIIAGGNLLCMHGLYYSTRGGWWEWAPPCFHFRMPYWEHMKLWLEYAERMCFVLSQGRHVCDVAVLYPTETMQAIPGSGTGLTFWMTEELSRNGFDFDFIDYQSLRNASVSDGGINVAGESYKVIVLADAKAMHESTVSQIEASAHEGRVLHRRVADNGVYMVMDVKPGDEMFFRSHGKVEIWDAMKGTISETEALYVNEKDTTLRFDGESGNSRLIVFSPGETRMAHSGAVAAALRDVIPVGGKWDIRLVPTMDNSWGDFRLPASDEKIGAEACSMRYVLPWSQASGELESVYGYGPYMMTAFADSSASAKALAESEGAGLQWEPYLWSWQFGVFDSPGSQGYHGLKGKVDDRFLILDRGGHQLFKTRFLAPEDGKYRIVREGVSPFAVRIDGKTVRRPVVRLHKGWHELFLIYDNTPRTAYSLQGMRSASRDNRARSMVMLYPVSSPEPPARGLYSSQIASKWYGTDFLPFSTGDARLDFSFDTAPGTRQLAFDYEGEILSVQVDGTDVLAEGVDGHAVICIPHSPDVSHVVVSARPSTGVAGAAFFASPVKVECSGGRMEAGDWTGAGALKYYSGGVRYSNTVTLVPESSARYVLNLGEVDATCEVSVNGSEPEVLLTRPYSFDVTEMLVNGENRIEVPVYSSLSNHYQTIPSPYRGTARAGLIGPVTLEIY